jgi:molecular chaperone GrpE
MVLKLFEDTAERMGLQRIKTVGERFDPAMHEALQQQETDVQPPGTILAEVVPGYMFGARLLRAAMVVVARKPSKPAPTAESGANGEEKGGGASA